jgi:phage tail protein X
MECHTWKDEDIQPVCPMPPKTGREIAEQKKTLLVGLDYKVYQHRNKITQIMDAGHGIAAVRDYLHEAYPDMNTSIKSVQVSYRRLVLGATAKRLGVEV